MIYTVTLSGDDAAELVSKLLPELDHLHISFNDCSLRITLTDGELDSIELDCGGSLRVVSRDIDSSVQVTVRFNDKAVETVPNAVRNVLVK